MMVSTLLLNADAQPISLLPISGISWQDAMSHLYLDDVEILHDYDNWTVHSPSRSIPVPIVAMLREQVPRKRHMRVSSSVVRHLMFLRDDFTCQYCGLQFRRQDLTVDHVLPRRYGGRTSWTNVITACETCNWNRGCDIRIQPMTIPVKPTYNALLTNLRKQSIVIPHPVWNYYLGWPEERIRYYDPKSGGPNTEFDLV